MAFERLNQIVKGEHTEYPKRYYSFIDKVEELPNGALELHLGSIQEKELDLLFDNPNIIQELVSYEIIAVLNQEQTKILFDDIERIDSTWHRIELSENTSEYAVELYEETSLEAPLAMYSTFIHSVQSLDATEAERLANVFSFKEKDISTEEKIKEVLHHAASGDSFNYNMYNVGQGNCSALCNRANGVDLYIDLGGGCYRNAHTYRDTLRICDAGSPPVILTHFDGDHYWTAHRSINQIASRDWIVPNQPLSPKQLLFVTRLVNSGHHIYVFPNNVSRLDIGSMTIVKCTGRTKNDSGLAVFLNIRRGGESFRVLNPGDAGYQHIPHLNDADLRIGGLVATHHGSARNIDWNNIPNAESPFRIIYSFGLGNIYGHVKHDSEKEHHNKGWIHKRSTVDGGVSFRRLIKRLHAGCRGRRCDLEISIGF